MYRIVRLDMWDYRKSTDLEYEEVEKANEEADKLTNACLDPTISYFAELVV